MVVALVAGTAPGRRGVAIATRSWPAFVDRIAGLPPADPWLDRDTVRAERLRNAASARQSLAKLAAGPAMDKFLGAAKMDARTAVIRWGNIDRSIVLSSAVFEPDDGRSYRLKPGVRSIWVIGMTLAQSLAMFLVPDEPEVIEAARRAGGTVVPQSLQTTNSWGCRGPEPDTTAPVRILVLGDSMMQGALVGNTDTPPAKLEYYLTQALKAHVCVLNTGHIGYSIEQYDQTLRALGDRFGPDFVVVSVSENDIGDLKDPALVRGGVLDRPHRGALQRTRMALSVRARGGSGRYLRAQEYPPIPGSVLDDLQIRCQALRGAFGISH